MGDAWDSFSGWVGGAADAVGDAVGGAVDAVTSAAETVSVAATAVGGAVQDTADNVAKWAQDNPEEAIGLAAGTAVGLAADAGVAAACGSATVVSLGIATAPCVAVGSVAAGTLSGAVADGVTSLVGGDEIGSDAFWGKVGSGAAWGAVGGVLGAVGGKAARLGLRQFGPSVFKASEPALARISPLLPKKNNILRINPAYAGGPMRVSIGAQRKYWDKMPKWRKALQPIHVHMEADRAGITWNPTGASGRMWGEWG